LSFYGAPSLGISGRAAVQHSVYAVQQSECQGIRAAVHKMSQ